jgi:hypothetical protein
MIWKDVEGYEGAYQISDTGLVRNKKGLMKIGDNGHGYKYISLRRDGKKKNHYIHRLVADAFVDHPSGKDVVNHRDYDTSNNNAHNLEWCTQKENIAYSKIHMKGRRNRTNTSTGERYICLRKKSHRYRITIDKKEYPTTGTLEEAIALRDKILREKGVV